MLATRCSRLSTRQLPKITLATGRYITSKAAKKEGDISSVFVSLSGGGAKALPERFTEIKKNLIRGHEEAVAASWNRLLARLTEENEQVARLGPSILPSIEFRDLENSKGNVQFMDEVRKRGCAVIRGVIDQDEARAYKTEIEAYIKANPHTKAFPPNDPQVFELYWSPSQTKARAHPHMLHTQRFLMSLWKPSTPTAPISTSRPLIYADRLRIRQPGDAGFALGPHVDGGSVERWEPHGYGLGGVYDKIWAGEWEEYNPWESSARIGVVSDNYNGAGACSMFRMWQGWLSMSHTGPKQGTLMVNPLLQLSTAYMLLRPFFEAIQPLNGSGKEYTEEYLRPENWRLCKEMSSELQGAHLGHGQELNDLLHPHLELGRTMVHVPEIRPGDYVAWHCDAIHAVDKIHTGTRDSSVMYIPTTPTTPSNLEYLSRQRDAFLIGAPGPDFPGGEGEARHVGRPTLEDLRGLGSDGLQAMGLERMVGGEGEGSGAREVVEGGNVGLGL